MLDYKVFSLITQQEELMEPGIGVELQEPGYELSGNFQ